MMGQIDWQIKYLATLVCLWYLVASYSAFAQDRPKPDPVNQTPTKNLSTARSLIGKGMETDALPYLNACLYRQAENREALLLRARIYNNHGLYAEALTDFLSLVFLEPANMEAKFGAAVARYNLGQYEMALVEFESLLDINNAITNTVYYHIDDQSGGISGISTISSLQLEITNYAGLCHYHLAEYDAALGYFNKGLSIDPSSTKILQNRAMVMECQGNYTFAIDDYIRLLRLEPENQQAIEALLRINDYNETYVSLLNEMIGENPHSPGLYHTRAQYYYRHGLYEQAMADFNRTVNMSPSNATYRLNMAICLMKLGNLNEAKTHLSILVEKEPDNPRLLFNMANVEFQSKNFGEALEYYSLAIHFEPDNATYFYNRALVNKELGRMDAACEDITTAKVLNQNIGTDLAVRVCLDSNINN